MSDTFKLIIAVMKSKECWKQIVIKEENVIESEAFLSVAISSNLIKSILNLTAIPHQTHKHSFNIFPAMS